MRIVIDLQGAQSVSRDRGIGIYSLQFSRALALHQGIHEIFIALNGAFVDTIEPIRGAFQGLLPQERILVWDAPGPVAEIEPSNAERRRAAEEIREAFIASLQPDWVLVTSLFEGFTDDVAISLGRHTSLRTAVILYDLIPLIHRGTYLQNPAMERWYLEKIDHLRRADLLLSISESSGKEAVQHLGWGATAVVPIGTDCDTRFRPIQLTEDHWAHLSRTYGIKRPFVMYTGGIDHRKNIDRLIAAYAALPANTRLAHQLAVVCAVQTPERERLLRHGKDAGLGSDELVLTGYVPDDDLLTLYNACTLFVFPSWHEGFGLPALEAMRCGKAVLAAKTSSLPEVMGCTDALFDPFDEAEITALMNRALENSAFRSGLESHGLEQSKRFSWDETARRALAAMSSATSEPLPSRLTMPAGRAKPKLAYVSPLPPERTGIADYSAELIPELIRWYEVEVVIDQPQVTNDFIQSNCAIRTVEEFRAGAGGYARVLYHFGNSQFHKHMFELLEEIPGIVVLHDFFLSGVQMYRESLGPSGRWGGGAIFLSHGYGAIGERAIALDENDIAWRYPMNLPVIQNALGVIVHGNHSCGLARQWYGDRAAADWEVIPLLRSPAVGMSHDLARKALGLAEGEILVCSFGMLGVTKLNHRLLDAWLGSPLATDERAHLMFVGENDRGDYGRALVRRIEHNESGQRIHITGWADTETFRRYLAAADIGVQLRTKSRGETSAAVLDCMNHGLATIVNAHGSLADLDPQGVWLLPDEFSDADLVEALTALACDVRRRRELGNKAKDIIHTHHAPSTCGNQYADAIERIYARIDAGLPGLLGRLAQQIQPEMEQANLAMSLARNFPPAPRRRQVLVDVSALVQLDAKTGIQRVVRAILREWLSNPPAGYQIEPVYATSDEQGYRYARRWTSHFIGVAQDWAEDAPADAWAGDVFVGLDLQPHVVIAQHGFLQSWRNRGVRVWFVVYDLLPVLLPESFPDGAQALHHRWLKTISHSDGVACISHAVADEMADWVATFGAQRVWPLAIDWFHLGADVQYSVPTMGLPADAELVLAKLSSRQSFLMVGTVEPRKGHAQTLEAFDQLWRKGLDVNLIIVGRQGWMMEKTVSRLRHHRELHQRLFWLEGISDEYLDRVYRASSCLIAASYGEGFGLPLIEAAQHKLPIIARDIPVFREVAGEHAYYFRATEPGELAQALRDWLALYQEKKHPRSDNMPWLTWRQSAVFLLQKVTSLRGCLLDTEVFE